MTGTALIGPAIAAIMMLGGWLIAGSRDDHGQPKRATVWVGEHLAMAGLLAALLALPRDLPPTHYAAGLAGTLLVGLGLLRGAGRLAIGWTTAAEVVTASAGLAWRTPARAAWSLVSLCAGLGLAVWLAGQGSVLAGLLGAAVALAPARWHLPAGYAREKVTTGIERALAGLMRGGLEWDSHEAALRGAPVRIRFDGDHDPARITMPVPPAWDEEPEQITKRVQKRLKAWGRIWRVNPDDSARFLVVTPGEKLPTRLVYDGARLDGLKLTLGLARLSEAAGEVAEPGEQGYLGQPGDLVPFVLDLEDTPAGLIVGTMGGGKSVLVRLMILIWCMFYPAVLLDPKRVEFSPFRGRHNVADVAKDLEEIAETFEAVKREMDRRYDLMEAAGVQKISELPDPPPDVLIVCDEYYELVAKEAGSDDETKAINELKARCANAARKLPALGRAAGLHPILLAQRADAEAVKGALQNNLKFRALMRPKGAGSTARSMIGMQEAPVTGNPPGRAVMQTDAFPESEVQVSFVSMSEVERTLPRWEDGGTRPALADLFEPVKREDDAAADDQPEADQTSEEKPAKRPKKPKEEAGQPASQTKPADDSRAPEPDPEDGPDFDLSEFED